MQTVRPINAVVIHCAASRNGDPWVDSAVITKWHLVRGFAKIGYHYVILIDGTVERGRDEIEIGAHVQGSNARSIGVCMVGTDRFTAAQWAALRTLITDLKSRYPNASIKGHRDYSPDLNGDGIIERTEWTKICPGFDVAAWLAAGMDPAWNPDVTCLPREDVK